MNAFIKDTEESRDFLRKRAMENLMALLREAREIITTIGTPTAGDTGTIQRAKVWLEKTEE